MHYFIPLKEVSRLLGCSREYAYSLARKGQLSLSPSPEKPLSVTAGSVTRKILLSLSPAMQAVCLSAIEREVQRHANCR